MKNAAFALMKSFSTPRRLAAAPKAKRSLLLVFLTPLPPCCNGGVPRKTFKIALQAASFSSCAKISHGKSNGRISLKSFRGFTLIETLVAISILAISLVVVLQLFSGSLKSSKLSDDYTRGIFYAREKMDEILLAEELTEGIIGGEFDDGFKWRAEALRLDIENAKDVKLPFLAFNISVDVRWDAGGKEKNFEIRAVKLVKPGKESL